jgi:phosphoenolpyruvate-protein phosphotransferase
VTVRAAQAEPARRIDPGAAAGELERVATASAAAARELEALAASVAAEGHAAEAEIFAAQATMAADPMLLDAVSVRVRSGEAGAGAVLAAADELATALAAVGDELIAARAADLRDVASRIAGHLGARRDAPVLDRPSIVVADDLAPSVTASLPRDLVLAIALERGSPTAHAAILARAYGIPAVVGVAGLLAAVTDAVPGDAVELGVDGSSGEVTVDPGEAAIARLDARARDDRARREQALAGASLPARTRDGTLVVLLANIGTPDEASAAAALGAQGVGLFRTEFLFLERPAEPGEDEQVETIAAVVRTFAGRPVTVRLLDAGADKPIPWLDQPTEPNPFLGVRGLRLATGRPDLFVRQLRAARRAAATPGAVIKVMAPMVADAGDAALLLELAERARQELDAEGAVHGDIELGAMLEVPSAVVTADAWFSDVAFVSLGTNDLLQYTVAVDRGNAALQRYQDPLHPALLRFVREAVAAADRAGIEVSVCGEMAGDPVAALALVGLGVRRLSMAASSLPEVRAAVRSADLEVLAREAAAALGDATASASRARFAAIAVVRREPG